MLKGVWKVASMNSKEVLRTVEMSGITWDGEQDFGATEWLEFIKRKHK